MSPSPWVRYGGPCPEPTPAPWGQPAPLAPAAARVCRAPSHLNRALRDKPRHQLDKATVASPGLPPDGHWASGTPRLRARPSGAPSEQPPEPGLTRDRAKPPPAPTSSLIPPSRPMGQSIPGISRSRHRPKCRVPGLLPGALGGGRVPWAVPSIPPHPRIPQPCPAPPPRIPGRCPPVPAAAGSVVPAGPGTGSPPGAARAGGQGKPPAPCSGSRGRSGLGPGPPRPAPAAGPRDARARSALL